MTIKEIFEHSQNVDGWILGIDGYASKVDLGQPGHSRRYWEISCKDDLPGRT